VQQFVFGGYRRVSAGVGRCDAAIMRVSVELCSASSTLFACGRALRARSAASERWPRLRAASRMRLRRPRVRMIRGWRIRRESEPLVTPKAWRRFPKSGSSADDRAKRGRWWTRRAPDGTAWPNGARWNRLTEWMKRRLFTAGALTNSISRRGVMIAGPSSGLTADDLASLKSPGQGSRPILLPRHGRLAAWP